MDKQVDAPPIPIQNIDWTGVIREAKGEVQSIVNGTYHEDNDNDHFMYEEVMKAIYGKDYFKWFNKNAYK